MPLDLPRGSSRPNAQRIFEKVFRAEPNRAGKPTSRNVSALLPMTGWPTGRNRFRRWALKGPRYLDLESVWSLSLVWCFRNLSPCPEDFRHIPSCILHGHPSVYIDGAQAPLNDSVCNLHLTTGRLDRRMRPKYKRVLGETARPRHVGLAEWHDFPLPVSASPCPHRESIISAPNDQSIEANE